MEENTHQPDAPHNTVPASQKMNARKPRRVLRTLGLTLSLSGGVLVLLVLLGLAFVRSNAGRAFVLDTAVQLAAQKGIYLHLESSTGTLPERLILKGVRVADSQGVFFRVQELGLHWKPWALLRGTLALDTLALHDPEWIRLPHIPQAEAPQPQDSDFLQTLPFLSHLSLRSLVVENAVLGAELFGTGCRFNLTGGSSLTATGGTVHARLELAKLGTGTALNVLLDAGLAPGTQGLALRVDAVAHEAAGGFAGDALAAALDVKALGWNASLRGNAPLADWQGALELTLGTGGAQPIPESSKATLMQIRGTLGFALAETMPATWHLHPRISAETLPISADTPMSEGCPLAAHEPAGVCAFAGAHSAKPRKPVADGGFEKMPVQWFGLLDLQARAGNAAPQSWQDMPLSLHTVLSGGQRGTDFFVRCNQATLSSPVGRVGLDDVEFKPAGSAFLLQGLLSATLEKGGLVRIVRPTPGSALDPAIVGACLNARFQLNFKDSQSRFAIKSQSELYGLSLMPVLPLGLTLHGAFDSRSTELRVDSLHVSAPESTLDAHGTLFPTERAGDLAFTFGYTDTGLLQKITALPFSGRLTAQGSLQKSLSEKNAPARLKLLIDGYALRLGVPALESLLGDHAQLRLHLSAKDDRAKDFQAEFGFTAAHLKAEGQARLTDSQYAASLQGRLDSLATLLPAHKTTAPVDGVLDMRLEMRAQPTPGHMSLMPQTGNARLQLSSPQLHTASGIWEDCTFALNAQLDSRLAQAVLAGDMQLDARLAAPPVPSDSLEKTEPLKKTVPFALKSGWHYALEKKTLSLSALRFEGAGLNAQADLQLILPPAALRLQGQAQADIQRWDGLSTLLGMTLEGAPAHLSLSFASGASTGLKNTSLRAALDIPLLEIDTTARVRQLKLTTDIQNVFGTPALRANLAMKQGFAGMLVWRSISADVQGSLDSLALKAHSTGTSKFSLAAVLAPRKEQLALNDFHFQDSQKKAGCALKQPAEIFWGTPFGVYAPSLVLETHSTGHDPVNGQITLAMSQNPQTCTLQLHSVPVRLLALLTPHPVPGGELSGNFILQAGQQPSISFALDAAKVAYADDAFAPLSLSVRGDTRMPDTLTVTAQLGGIDADEAHATLHVPLETHQGLLTPRLDAPLSANLLWQGALAPLWRFVPLSDRRFTGTGRVQLDINGTLRKPEIRGRALLCSGRFEDLVNGILLTDISLEALYAPTGMLDVMLRAYDARPEAAKRGSLALDGRIWLPVLTSESAFSPSQQLALRVLIDDLAPLQRDDLSIDLSGDLNVAGSLVAPWIRGTILVESGDLNLVSGFGASVPMLEIREKNQPEEKRVPPPQSPHFDVAVKIPDRFFIRGRGLESEWKGHFSVGGSLNNPLLVGALEPVRGRFELLGNPCNISKGRIDFTGESPPNPMLNLELNREAGDITALVEIGGTARKPHLTLKSVPPLPQDEVMSYVLFGKPTAALSRFEALQAANAVRNIAGIGGNLFDPVASVRKMLGVDVLRVGSAPATKPKENAPVLWGDAAAQQNSKENNSEGAMTLEAGKYVMDNVYVGVEQNAESGAPGVRVEIELLPKLNLEGSTNSDISELGVSWKKDY